MASEENRGDQVGLVSLPGEVISRVSFFVKISKDLASFAASCRKVYPEANRVLYIRNVEEQNSSVITWAGDIDAHSRGSIVMKHAISAMKMALKYGANINTAEPTRFTHIVHMLSTRKNPRSMRMQIPGTAAHYAAASGKRMILKFLIANGARLDLVSNGTLAVRLVYKSHLSFAVNTMRPISMRNTVFHSRWLPMLAPFILCDKATVMILLEAGALGFVSAMRHWDHYDLTVIHLLAIADNMNLGATLLQKFPQLLNRQCLANSYSPLHVAVHNENLPFFSKLVTANAYPNSTTLSGRTPLLDAIHLCSLEKDSKSRAIYAQMAVELIKNGADVNQGSMFPDSHIPLTQALASSSDHEWSTVCFAMRKIIDALLNAGADVNTYTASGKTVLHHLFSTLLPSTKQTPDILRPSQVQLFRFFVSRGADPNIHLPCQMSILYMAATFVHDNNRRKAILPLLIECGARFMSNEEMESTFQIWARDRNRKILGVIAESFKSDAAAIDHLYQFAIHEDSEILFDALWMTIRQPSSMEILEIAVARFPETKLSMERIRAHYTFVPSN